MTPPIEPAPADAAPSGPTDPARGARLASLREQLNRLDGRSARHSIVRRRPQVNNPDLSLPFVRSEHPLGPLHAASSLLERDARHGSVALAPASDAHPAALATLALDPALRACDPARALYLDTETTGLSGGTGTLAFLVGLAWFEHGRLCTEQLFLAEPAHEPALLAHLATRIAAASMLVTFNGKAFDLPLLRARYVMNRQARPEEPPHFDLVHASRRVYGARTVGCRLTTLEQDVLGFTRVDDVPSSEIPARYTSFLRGGGCAGIVPVVQHNAWDVIAMAALLGELTARAMHQGGTGRFEPSDAAGLAQTAMRAGDTDLATHHAQRALDTGDALAAARAAAVVSRVNRTRGDHHATERALRRALATAPRDPALHLALAKLYEHRLDEPDLALVHARAASAAEDPAASRTRVARLTRRAARFQPRLPGIA